MNFYFIKFRCTNAPKYTSLYFNNKMYLVRFQRSCFMHHMSLATRIVGLVHKSTFHRYPKGLDAKSPRG